MASISQVKEIFSITPNKQAIMLVAGHGVGKSELIMQLAKEEGARYIPLFLGQAADAGDIIGLPKHCTDEKGNSYTDFLPPKWWPTNMNEKVYIHLDELNRGKPEIMQCVMDMVLNNKLNGRSLPEQTRIVACINPSNDQGTYQVEELDPALVDRFNVYELTPTFEEWYQWAVKAKTHRMVLAYLAANQDRLDHSSLDIKDHSKKSVQQSRRSWIRVSDILNDLGDNFNKNLELLYVTFSGIIGNICSKDLTDFIKKNAKVLTPNDLMTYKAKPLPEKMTADFQDEWVASFKTHFEKELAILTNPDKQHINSNIEEWFKSNSHNFKSKEGKPALKTASLNLYAWLTICPPEIMAEFIDRLIQSFKNNSDNKWHGDVLKANPLISTRFMERMDMK